MASTPDQNPDTIPDGPSEDVEQVSSTSTPGRESVEDTPGSDGGTAGTGENGGQSLVQDQEFER